MVEKWNDGTVEWTFFSSILFASLSTNGLVSVCLLLFQTISSIIVCVFCHDLENSTTYYRQL